MVCAEALLCAVSGTVVQRVHGNLAAGLPGEQVWPCRQEDILKLNLPMLRAEGAVR